MLLSAWAVCLLAFPTPEANLSEAQLDKRAEPSPSPEEVLPMWIEEAKEGADREDERMGLKQNETRDDPLPSPDPLLWIEYWKEEDATDVENKHDQRYDGALEKWGYLVDGVARSVLTLERFLEMIYGDRSWEVDFFQGCSVTSESVRDRLRSLRTAVELSPPCEIEKALLSLSRATFCAVHFQTWLSNTHHPGDDISFCGHNGIESVPEAECSMMEGIDKEVATAAFHYYLRAK